MTIESQSMQVTSWDASWAQSVKVLQSSAIRELLKVTEQPGVISFAGGLPAPECFPAEEIALASERVLATQASRVLQYGPTEGLSSLRELLAEMMQNRGIPTKPEQVLITSGSQQALDMLGKLLIDPGAPVLVEEPTYVGALQAWRPYRPDFVPLPMDQDGLRIDALEQAVVELSRAGRHPKFLYVVSSFQNPTGVTLAPDRRRALVELAAQHDLPVVEDDPYGELYYVGEPQPKLAALEAQLLGEQRNVVYLSTFSKLLAPGLRVGWVVGPQVLLRRMAQVKQGLDLHTGSLAQAIAYESCRDGLLERHIPRIRAIYAERREVMLAALERANLAGVHWTRPSGGMFLWLTLPQRVDAADLLKHAIERSVVFVPGDAFHANGGGKNTLRLNFSHAPPERIVEGIARLATTLREYSHE